MDNFARLAVIQGLIPAAQNTQPRVGDDRRRYAVYFSSRPSLLPKASETDAGSTWTFSASELPRSGSSGSSNNTSVESGVMTPAKRIVDSYRARHSLEQISQTSSGSSYSSEYSQTNSSNKSSPFESRPFPTGTLKPKLRRSRHEALLTALQEAQNIANVRNLGPHETIACPRSGCHDLLPGIHALAYHLDIHDIHDCTIGCNRCKDRFEDQTALRLHQCNKSHVFALPSISAFPLRYGFQKVVALLHKTL
ncbi:hypothetical protein JR316_0005712 [Psilocybe cubensis]|uniref:C2H2-type domain-containing protein n=2 Tax=Psilocybe cubensis TaxID=181762 RepID=A0A8H8CLL7_PSICU|nr:hypothetical protein JR316_0005712 [Psilocybe cubensis]KAH9481192.1 hypothetical protein JR316_0005712 [Psilocybe cubensis]